MEPELQALSSPKYVFDLGPRPWLPVAGRSEVFTVRNIYCVGRNYADHAREMGHDPDREPPFFFMKSAEWIAHDGSDLVFPVGTENLHHEVELVVAIGVGGLSIPSSDALDHVWGYAVGLDMTRRDLQTAAKKMGRPWEMGKSFDQSAPVSALRPVSDVGHPSEGSITLSVDGEVRQRGDLSMQIWDVSEQISHLSQLVCLQAGDLIFTGTPAGVGQVMPGSRIDAAIAGIGQLTVTYKAP